MKKTLAVAALALVAFAAAACGGDKGGKDDSPSEPSAAPSAVAVPQPSGSGDPSGAPAAGAYDVVFKITGAGTVHAVFYSINGKQTPVPDPVKVPWSAQTKAAKGDRLYLAATSPGREVTCSILVGGKEVVEMESSLSACAYTIP